MAWVPWSGPEKRRHRPMFMVDLAVPRDIEPEVKAPGRRTCTPWTTWPAWCKPRQANRQAAVAQAEAIVDAGVQSFMHWIDQRQRAADPAAQRPGRCMAGGGDRPRASAGQGRGRDETVLEAPLQGPDAKDAARRHGRTARGRAPARERASMAIQHFFLRNER